MKGVLERMMRRGLAGDEDARVWVFFALDVLTRHNEALCTRIARPQNRESLFESCVRDRGWRALNVLATAVSYGEVVTQAALDAGAIDVFEAELFKANDEPRLGVAAWALSNIAISSPTQVAALTDRKPLVRQIERQLGRPQTPRVKLDLAWTVRNIMYSETHERVSATGIENMHATLLAADDMSELDIVCREFFQILLRRAGDNHGQRCFVHALRTMARLKAQRSSDEP
jgi:hypothetical protein